MYVQGMLDLSVLLCVGGIELMLELSSCDYPQAVSGKAAVILKSCHSSRSLVSCTLCPKKRLHFYFLNNSVKNETILIIFGILNPEGT